jgi:hypothetical protein
MLAGLVIVPVVSLMTPKPDKKLVDDAFACYETKVTVTQREALGTAAGSSRPVAAENSRPAAVKGKANRRRAVRGQ